MSKLAHPPCSRCASRPTYNHGLCAPCYHEDRRLRRSLQGRGPADEGLGVWASDTCGYLSDDVRIERSKAKVRAMGYGPTHRQENR